MDRIKTIIVTPSDQIHEFFQEQYQDTLDCQHQVPTIDDMGEQLSTGELDDTSRVIIFDDNLIEDGDVNEISEAIATYAPYAIVCLLSYKDDFHNLIFERVKRNMDPELQAPFFIITSDYAMDELDEVLEYNNAFLEGREDIPKELKRRPTGNPAFISDQEIETIEKEIAEEEDPNARKGYVISSTSSKGGSGKSTVALTLATTIAQASHKAYKEKLTRPDEEPLKVCVVDMDIFDGQLGMYIGQLQPTALNVRITGLVTPENVARNLVYDEFMMIHALLAPKRGVTARNLTPEFYKQVIETLKTMFDLIILDTSVQYLDPLISKVCLPMSDAILFIANLSAGAVYGMTRWIKEVTGPKKEGGMAINKGKIGVVLNQVMDNVGMDKTTLAEAALDTKIISMIPMASQIVLSASNYNRLSRLPENDIMGPSYYKLAQTIVRGMSTKDKPITLAPLIDEKAAEVRNRNEQRKAAGREINAGQDTKKKRGLFGLGK